jgi:hypothetical protein
MLFAIACAFTHTVCNASELDKNYPMLLWFKSQQKYIDSIKKWAEKGDRNDQFELGCRYDKGEGILKDPFEAVKWYRKAAEQGDKSAQFDLGVCYDEGEGVPKDPFEAVKWYRKAAEQGDRYAKFNLAISYARGEGVPKNPVEAVKLYRNSDLWFMKLGQKNEAVITSEQIAKKKRLQNFL